jgi:Putative peptidoglycan-binding domain-containing protein
MTPTPNTLKLLLDFEVGGGESFYNARLKRPVWPGAQSGVTIGVGYDLGYVTRDQFLNDWQALEREDRNLLAGVIGLKADAAKNALSRVRTVEVPWSIAYAVFTGVTLPRFWEQTRQAFPGVESLPGDVQGALLSLVFNRGASMNGDRRLEMRQIREAIAGGDVASIPRYIRAMNRLWAGTDIETGMRRRREAEAALVESALAGGVQVPTGETEVKPLPPLARVLRRDKEGDDVKALQRALAQLGFYKGAVDGEFGPITERAVRDFQRKAALTVDGVVGKLTWEALNGEVTQGLTEDREAQVDRRKKLAAFAKEEAAKGLTWTNKDSEAEKYLKPLREPMRKLGHIGASPVLFDWCAAFVTYCCREVGYTIPDQPPGFWATVALVESWKFWAKENGWWHPRGTITPEPGDIVCFEWGDGDAQLDHIGIVRAYTPGSAEIETSEGNVGNRSKNLTRRLANCAGFIRLAP